MGNRTLRGSGFALLLCIVSAAAVRAADPQAPGWMAGSWTGVQDGLAMEEVWTAVDGGSMLGLHRDVKDGRTVSFEFLRIEASPEGVTYWASPQGRPATPFRLVESASGRVVFENTEHAYPRRILYWLSKDGNLNAKIEGVRDGRPAAEAWSWRRSR
jgi:uncharacterized protein YfiM (DUF2279 family)